MKIFLFHPKNRAHDVFTGILAFWEKVKDEMDITEDFVDLRGFSDYPESINELWTIASNLSSSPLVPILRFFPAFQQAAPFHSPGYQPIDQPYIHNRARLHIPLCKSHTRCV